MASSKTNGVMAAAAAGVLELIAVVVSSGVVELISSASV